MRLVDSVVEAPAPRPVAPHAVSAVVDDAGRRRVIAGIEEELDRALRLERTFTSLRSAFTEAS